MKYKIIAHSISRIKIPSSNGRSGILPDCLLHQKHLIAFESLLLQETQEFLTKNKIKKLIDSGKEISLTMAIPTMIAGIIGTNFGGLASGIEAIKQFLLMMGPYSLIHQGVKAIIQSRMTLKSINFIRELQRKFLIDMLLLAENKSKMIAEMVSLLITNVTVFYGLASLAETVFGIPNSKMLVVETAVFTGLFKSFYKKSIADRWRNKIKQFAENKPEEISQLQGKRIGLVGLRFLLNGVLNHPKKTEEIFVATSEKKFRGNSGGLGFLGAIDSLADGLRDDSRLKPNVTLRVRADDFDSYSYRPHFNFSFDRTRSKTETILEIANLVNLKCNGVRLKIHPIFARTTLEGLLFNPYEELSAVYLTGEKDKVEYFKIKYDFKETRRDNLDIRINFSSYLDIVLELFESCYERPLEDADFDAELFELDRGRNVLDFMEPQGRVDLNQVYIDDEILIKENPEPPLAELEELSDFLKVLYNENKAKILQAHGFDGISFALQGTLFSLSPMDEVETSREAGTLVSMIINPWEKIKSKWQNIETESSLREARVFAQITGITPQNVIRIVDIVTGLIKELRIRPSMNSFDYKTFLAISDNPHLITENSYNIELIDDSNTMITISFNSPQKSYETIRRDSFPTKEESIRRAQESIESYKHLGVLVPFGMILDLNRRAKGSEELPYEIISKKQGHPEHIVIYNKDDTLPFQQNSTIIISTAGKIFFDNPVPASKGIDKIVRYLSIVREVVQYNQKR